MLDTFKRLRRLFMSDEPPTIHSLFPRTTHETDASYWCNSILGQDVTTANSCSLTQLDHCKSTRSPRHEFLLAYLTLDLDGKVHDTCILIDRRPAPEVEEQPAEPKTASATSLICSPSTISSPSPSPSPSLRFDHTKGILGSGGKVPATDRVMVPRSGEPKELRSLTTRTFGEYFTLNTLTIDKGRMSAPQLATVLDIAHKLAPEYTLRKHQCYWFSLIIFLVVKSRTGGRESHGERIVQRGKLFGLSPEHSAGEDEMVAQEEYDKAWRQFNAADAERRRNPEQARKLAEERAAELDKARVLAEERAARAERKADDERKKADDESKARVLAEERAAQAEMRFLALESEMLEMKAKRSPRGHE